jgi:hypothetical protein
MILKIGGHTVTKNMINRYITFCYKGNSILCANSTQGVTANMYV